MGPLADPSEDALDASPQLGVVVRLGDVVLGELVEEVRLVVAGIDRGQDDDREVRPGLDLARQRQAVHPRHQQVDDEEVRPRGIQPAKSLLAVAGRRDIEAVLTELLGERDEHAAVVVDQQDPWSSASRGRRPSRH